MVGNIEYNRLRRLAPRACCAQQGSDTCGNKHQCGEVGTHLVIDAKGRAHYLCSEHSQDAREWGIAVNRLA